MQTLFIKRTILIITGLMLVLNWRTPAIAADAVLSWNQNTETDLAGYKVYYGTASRSYGSPTDVGNKTTFTVTGLNGQTYYFAVTAYDTAGNESGYSNEVSKTLSDTTPPVLSAIGTSGITSSAAVISWTTNEPASAQVEYGTTTVYGSLSTLDSALLTSHSRTLSSLTPSTLYHYRVISKDAAGNVAASGDNTFTTAAAPDTTPPAISGIATTNITPTSATIGWSTNESADTQIQYGATTAYGSSTALNPTLATTHSQNLTGLTPSTTYHYRVLSKDAAGNLATSGDNTFITPAPPDTTPPTFSGITASGLTSNSVAITWSTNEPATTQVEYGLTTSYGSLSTLDATLVTNHTRTLSGLNPSTTYHFRVISKDAADNTATSGDNTFTTSSALDTTPPVLSAIAAGSVTATSAVITWTTNEAATAQVEYGTTTAYGSSSALDSALLTGHSRTLTNLSPSTLYHFRVLSRDAAGNLATSGDNTFTTSATSDTTGPVLSQITVSDVREDRVTLSWGTDESATTQVEYGLTPAYGNLITLNATLLNSHSQIVSGLQADTVYHYRVRSADASGNLSLSEDRTFTTNRPTDTVPPADVERFTAVPGIRIITLDWVNPSDPDFVGVRIIYRTDRFPTGLNDGTVLGDFAGEPDEPVSVIHPGLDSRVTYYYSASAYDRSGNFQQTAHASATPFEPTESGTTQGDGGSGAGGGCAMISSTQGDAGGPLGSADWLGLIGLILAGLVRKRRK